MTPKELLIPRIKVIDKYPGMECEPFHLGQIITMTWHVEDGWIHTPVKHIPGSYMGILFFDNYPHLFRRLEWWEFREDNEVPEYVRITSVGCTVEQGGVVKVIGTGIYPDEGRELGNEGNRYVMIDDKYLEEYGPTRMNCRNCIPATETEYKEYLKQKEANNG